MNDVKNEILDIVDTTMFLGLTLDACPAGITTFSSNSVEILGLSGWVVRCRLPNRQPILTLYAVYIDVSAVVWWLREAVVFLPSTFWQRRTPTENNSGLVLWDRSGRPTYEHSQLPYICRACGGIRDHRIVQVAVLSDIHSFISRQIRASFAAGSTKLVL
ncbi:hypothetical protein EVAR_3939_1 [Eumeta japonica]|uniref:Uncharacterized protein n=1 Tax=Eumeta variegata TaxID=151549 RepID=A0A4C1SRQ9_EUMVA|nr:hypothetical protein EVAR_3939_1 [Eumeta japonica]